MHPSRTVACPHCGGTRETKARSGTRLACTTCGEAFRAPPPDTDDQKREIVDSPGPDTPPRVDSGVQISSATRTRVRQTARPRERVSEKTELIEDDARDQTKPSVIPPVISGIRGGRAFYGAVRGRRGRG